MDEHKKKKESKGEKMQEGWETRTEYSGSVNDLKLEHTIQKEGRLLSSPSTKASTCPHQTV